MLKIPTYQDCVNICNQTDNQFYESQFSVDGYKISIFNYRYVTYQDFAKFDAFELRGLTFVFNLDGSIYNRFLLMEKFFNINENESTSFELVKNKKIKSVYLKEDGSIINFIGLPNGRILAKSKTSFDSEQAQIAQKLYDSNPKLNHFVNNSIQNGINPIFELVGPKNRVVVKYDITELILIRLRDNISGNYLDIDTIDFNTPLRFSFSLMDTINLKSELVNIEGWIVEFVDGQKIKIKTDWYLSLHKIFTDFSQREDYLITLILDEKIDDVLSVLDFGSESRLFVENIISKTHNKINHIKLEINRLINDYDGDRKKFALKYHNDEYFSIAVKSISNQDTEQLIKEFIKKKTYRLNDARQWLD
jgi:T4 RnlA family RNA ligase